MIWKKGKFLDLWTVVHLMWGAIGGVFATLVTPLLGGLVLFILFLLVSVLWEIAENVFHISYEYIGNKVIDVVGASLTYGIFYTLFSEVQDSTRIYTLILLGFIFISLNVMGGMARAKDSTIEEFDYGK